MLGRWAAKSTDNKGATKPSRVHPRHTETTSDVIQDEGNWAIASHQCEENAVSRASASKEASTGTGEYAESASSDMEGREPASATDASEQAASIGQGQHVEGEEVHLCSTPPLPQHAVPRSTMPSISRPPKRPTDEVVVVRIGDQTSRTTGSRVKRTKLGSSTSAALTSSGRRKKRSSAPLPSFGVRLSQAFSAANSTQREEVEETEDDLGGSDVDAGSPDVSQGDERSGSDEEAGKADDRELSELEDEVGKADDSELSDGQEEGSLFIANDQPDRDATPVRIPPAIGHEEGKQSCKESDEIADDETSSHHSLAGSDSHASGCDGDDGDEEYVDESEKKVRE